MDGQVPNGVETLPKISIVWVGRTNVTDRQTDKRTGDYYSEPYTACSNDCLVSGAGLLCGNCRWLVTACCAESYRCRFIINNNNQHHHNGRFQGPPRTRNHCVCAVFLTGVMIYSCNLATADTYMFIGGIGRCSVWQTPWAVPWEGEDYLSAVYVKNLGRVRYHGAQAVTLPHFFVALIHVYPKLCWLCFTLSCAVRWAWRSATVSLLVPRLLYTRVRLGLGLGSACEEIAIVIKEVPMKFHSMCAQPLWFEFAFCGKSSESVQCAMLKACDACADMGQV